MTIAVRHVALVAVRHVALAMVRQHRQQHRARGRRLCVWQWMGRQAVRTHLGRRRQARSGSDRLGSSHRRSVHAGARRTL
jgi:hypothetical protein